METEVKIIKNEVNIITDKSVIKEIAIKMSMKSYGLAEKLEKVADDFESGAITMNQAKVREKILSSSARVLKDSYFMRNDIIILPEDPKEE